MAWSRWMALLGVVAVLCAGLWILGWRRRHARAAKPYLAITTALLVWTLAYMWELGAGSMHAMLLAAKVQYLAIPVVPVATLGLALTYTGRWRWQRPSRVLPVLVIPFLTEILAWTNGSHHLIWRTVEVHAGAGWSLLHVTYGWFFWVYAAFSYLILLIALALILDSAARRNGVWRRQSILIAVGTAAPFFGNVLYIFKISPFGPLDPTVFLFAVTCLTLGPVALNPRFLTLAPVARDLVLDIISDGVVVGDGHGRVTDINARAAAVLGVSPVKGVGEEIAEVLGPFRSQLEVEAGTTTIHEVEVDGSPCTFSCTRVPLDTGAPVDMGSTFVLHDISEQASANRALERARNELESRVEERTRSLSRANEMLNEEIRRTEESQERERALISQLFQAQKLQTVGTLMGGVAHDFKNLLTVIVGNADVALAEAPDDDMLREDLQQILGAARQATELANRLLSFARPGKERRARLDLAGSVDEAVQLLRAMTPRDVDIRTSVDETAPMVLADPVQLQQVFMNLGGNAVHAVDGNGVVDFEVGPFTPPAETLANAEGSAPHSWVGVRVRDNGHGMSPETVAHIFEPFFTTKGTSRGTGLGLSVVHKIVTAHGGDITVESSPGMGSAFTVYLPAAPEALEAES